jgi:hypothetical protein
VATSGTYNFANTPSDQIIIEAFERIGIIPDIITVEQINSAQRSANLILSDWINRGMNLWTLTPTMISLVANQSAYLLPTPMNRIIVANIRNSVRQLNGTPFSSAGGIAGNAFDGNPATACTQTSPNGYISYNYGTGNLINVQMVGIQSNVTTTYTLALEYSPDNINWTTSMLLPPQSYPMGINQWFVLQTPVPSQYFRVRETGGGTLNVQELYFNNTIQDIPMSEISVTDYWKIPIKNQIGRPTSFYLQRDINPILYLWPTPAPYFNNLFYIRERLLQDIGQLTNQAEIPQRFYEALICCLSFQLALKYMPDRSDKMETLSEKAFDRAAREDAQVTPLRIWGDYDSGWTRE